MCLTSGVGFGAVAGRKMSRLRRAEEKLRRDVFNPYEFLQLKQTYEVSAIGVGEEDDPKRTGNVVVDLPPYPFGRICMSLRTTCKYAGPPTPTVSSMTFTSKSIL